MGASVFLSGMTFQSRSTSNYLLPLQALPLGKRVSILYVIQFRFTVAPSICSLPAELEEWRSIVLWQYFPFYPAAHLIFNHQVQL